MEQNHLCHPCLSFSLKNHVFINIFMGGHMHISYAILDVLLTQVVKKRNIGIYEMFN